MSTPTLYEKLETFRRKLMSTGTLTLPTETRASIQSILKDLVALLPEIKTGEEQRRLEAVYRVSQVLGTSLSLDEVLNQVMDAAIELTGAERGFSMLVDSDSGNLTIYAARNFKQVNLEAKEMEVSRSVIQTVVETATGVVTTNAQQDPRFSQQASVVMYGLRSILCVPLRARGQVIGVMYADNRAQNGMFGKSDLDALQAFANQAAVAIENARLYTLTDQKLKDRVSELEMLTHIDRQLNVDLEIERVLKVAREWALRGTRATQSWIALFDEEKMALQVMIGPQRGQTIQEDDSLVADALRLSSVQSFVAQEDQPARLVAPLLQANQRLGVLVVERENDFSNEEAQFLARLAGHATMVIQNARLVQAVQHANQAKSQFVSFVSHELRIPMTSIKGYADLIRKEAVGPVTEQQRQFLDIIQNNVERMSALVSDLSEISRIESGRLKIEPQMVALQSCIHDTVISLRHKMEEKGQTLQTQVADDLPQVYSDHNRVIQVLTNLISNAWKYTPEHGDIFVHAFPKNDFIRIEVRDTGIGISPEDQQKLFSQFFRSEDPAVREQPGWGLGLHVTQRLVHLLGGEIGLISEVGKGSTFWFTLPTHA